MKNRNKLLLMLLVIIPMFVSVVFAIWYISDFKIAAPDFKPNDVLTKYINDQETTYDGNYQLPAPQVFEDSISLNTKDITYYFKLNGSTDEYVLCVENEIGPKNTGIYDIKVKYDLSYTDIKGNYIPNICEKEITFTINKYKYNLEGISFVDTSKVYNGETQIIEVTGTLPTGLTVTYDGGGKNVNFSPYTVTANFITPDEINYEQIESKTAILTITPLDISSEDIIISFVDNKDTYAYLESSITPSIKVLFNGEELILNTDFSVNYTNNTLDSQTARKTSTANITGIGNFIGTRNINYDIVRYMYLGDDKTKMQSFTYDGTTKYPKVILYSDDSYNNKITDNELNSTIFTYNANYKDSIEYYNDENQTSITFYEINVSASLTGYELFKSINVKYQITQKEIENIEWSNQTTFTYNGSYQSPTATASGIIEGDTCNVNIINITGGGKNAGNYTVKINSEKPLSNLNYKIPSGLTNTTCSYTINKAKIQDFGDTITLTNKYIEGDEPVFSKTTGYTLKGITPSGGSQEIINSAEISNINYSVSKFTDGEVSESQKTSLIITFKTNNSNYEDYVYTASIDIYAVATIGSSYYGTVERALEAANSSNDVYLIPERNPTIRKNAEIKSGVTLYIVYEEKSFKDNRESTSNGFFADEKNADKYLKNTLYIAENIILTNNGNLKIDGIVGNAGQTYAGQTSGSYTQIMMKEKSIINSNGTIYCLGYIKEETDENGSQVNIKEGTLSAPLVLYDFKGGSNSYLLNENNICPFKIYDVPNVQPLLNITAGAKYEALTSLYMRTSLTDSQQNHILQSGIYVIGNNISENALFILNAGIVSLKFNYNTNYKNSDMKITIKGNCKTGNLSLSMNIAGIDANIDTSKYFCPIPYKMKVYIDSGLFELNTKIEFLPGSKLIVEENGELTINSYCIFYESYTDNAGAYNYPTTINNENLSPALLEINGICNVFSNFAGIITSNQNSAKLIIGYNYNYLNNITDGNCSNGNIDFSSIMGGLISGNIVNGDLKYANTNQFEKDISLQNAELYAIGYIDSIDNYSRFNNLTSYKYNGNYWEEDIKYYTVTFNFSNASITDLEVNDISVSLNSNNTIIVKNGDKVTFKSLYEKDKNQSTKITGAKFSKDDNPFVFSIDSSDVTINVSSEEGTCLVEGTLISMADGSYKKVEDLKVGDLVKVFNHETGNIDNSPIIVNIHESETSRLTSIINLVFDNDQITRISFEHGFFDIDLNKYIYINNQNYNSMIGHRFYTINGSIITLIDAYITEEYVKVFSPVTYKHLNIFADDLLSITGGIYGLFNIFELNDDMTINIDKFNEDIEQYGLYKYSEWSDYMTLEEFESVNFKYFKIAVAKGIITIDELIKIILS